MSGWNVDSTTLVTPSLVSSTPVSSSPRLETAHSGDVKDAPAQSFKADGTPKRPMNGFMIFSRERKPALSAANPKMRPGKIRKILGQEWRAMDISEKQPYLDQAKRLRDAFDSRYSSWTNPSSEKGKNRISHLSTTDPEFFSDGRPTDQTATGGGDSSDGVQSSHGPLNPPSSSRLDDMSIEAASAMDSVSSHEQTPSPVTTGIPMQEDGAMSEEAIVDPVEFLQLDLHPSAQGAGYQDDFWGCLKGTRGTILEAIESWVNDSTKPPIFWLNGPAGEGKSAIAQAVTERCNADGPLISSFFCSLKFDEHHPRLLFPSLAIQLARQHPEIRSTLVSLLRSNPDVVFESPSEQVEKLIVKPLKSADVPAVIVVDALDEWGDDESQSGILSAMGLWVKEMPKTKFLVTSRPKPHISTSLHFPLLSGVADAFAPRGIASHVVDSDSDIRIFLEHELSAARIGPTDWPTAAQLDLLCARAAGLFVFAVATVKFLGREPESPDKQFTIIEHSPDDTVYEGTMEGVHKGLSLDRLCTSIFQASFKYNDAEDDDAVRLVLAGVVLVTNPLPPSTIADLISLEVREVMTILESIQPLLKLQGPDQPVHPFHKLLSDLLTSPTRCADERFHIAPGKFHSLIALRCLNLMNEALEGGLSPLQRAMDTEVEFPHRQTALKYAYASWHIHLAESRELFASLIPTLRHFLREKFMMWLDVPDAVGVATDPVFALRETTSWLREVVKDERLLNTAEICLHMADAKLVQSLSVVNLLEGLLRPNVGQAGSSGQLTSIRSTVVKDNR
ncbi:hypothetical protein BJ322DRAFT_1114717 [Thelephora terrestris]|uniref:HMG box domain-containing protein n=1 Tax=Thelephora terrestris TaxID=56493 RepID=A0A9P6H2W5_9AGAM|nr:hypothetical protein BJ322DRAFT_1114717 [Thelephora terrestris]